MRPVWVVSFTKVGTAGRADTHHQLLVRRDLYSEAEAKLAPARVFGRKYVRAIQSVEEGMS